MKKVQISDDCIGCGVCEGLCDYLFKINSATGISEPLKNNLTDSEEIKMAEEASSSCPVGAINIIDVPEGQEDESLKAA